MILVSLKANLGNALFFVSEQTETDLLQHSILLGKRRIGGAQSREGAEAKAEECQATENGPQIGP